MLTYTDWLFTFVRLICSICYVLSTMLASNKTKIQYNTIRSYYICNHSVVF